MPADRARPDRWWYGLLRCPVCRRGAIVSEEGAGAAVCDSCREHFVTSPGGALDLRRKREATVTVESGPLVSPPPVDARIGRPDVPFSGESSWRAPAELLGVLGSLLPRGATLLDAGCGGAAFRKPATESLGLQYVGLDIEGEDADALADLHSVPFADGSFDGVVSFAVLSCCRSPEVAVSELARVLKPGGSLVATIGLLEPFVGDAHRLTHRGLVQLLAAHGLRTDRLWACRDALEALGSYIGPYPSIVKRCLRLLAVASRWGPLSPRRWLRESPRERAERELWTAGSLGFVAHRSGPVAR